MREAQQTDREEKAVTDAPLLEVRNLSTGFYTERGVFKAVEGVSFTVNHGEILGVVGESGCGKSVTSQSILRLYDEKRQALYSGQILFKGEDILSLPPGRMKQYRGQHIAMVFQDALSALNPVFTVGDQIAETLKIHKKMKGKELRNRAVEMLRLVGIPDPAKRISQFPHELSGGMRQRVMIAIALACEPRLLIADEPTTALDVTIQAQIMDLIIDLNRRFNMGVILITHDLAVVAETCRRVVVMYLGQVVEEAPVDELFDNPRHPYTQGLLKSIPHIRGSRERLYMIPGTVPLLDQIPSGCRFAGRCPFAEDSCFKEAQELKGFPKQHSVRCRKAAGGAGG
ncbi:MAG: ABC transporter ATP-binding protein [Treponema sp.]|jgi:oligopeptide/dipeptide ABC transporter ATP-binding protein|nr:ABC transporter ATP-binding protein [Treponema sp.]